MARFCGNCGAQLEDTMKVCGQCGTPVEGAVFGNVPKGKMIDPEKQQKLQKKIKGAAILIVVALVAVVGFNIASQYTGYHGLLRKVMKAYEKYDVDTIVSLSSDIYYYAGEDMLENLMEDKIGDDLDYFAESVGHNYSFSYEIDEIYEMPAYKLQEVKESFSSVYDEFNADSIKKIVVAELDVTAKQGTESTSTSLEVGMSKENGGWKLMYID